MLYYVYAPQMFLRSTMIPIPKGRKVCSTNADLHRSIAISSILSKILDYNTYVIIDQQVDSLATRDYQFGFKSHSSTMLCSTMLIETIQYYAGMRLGFGQNSGKFYDAIDSNPIQHRRF